MTLASVNPLHLEAFLRLSPAAKETCKSIRFTLLLPSAREFPNLIELDENPEKSEHAIDALKSHLFKSQMSYAC